MSAKRFVEDCEDCPFVESGGWGCTLDDEHDWDASRSADGEAQSWCPLRRSPVLVVLENG